MNRGLPDGSYELYESQAPAGYAMHSGIVHFTVTNGLITSVDSPSAANGLVDGATSPTVGIYNSSDGLMHFTFWFENTAGTELPSTGQAFGLSRMGFASLGTVLLTAFVALYMYKKKQRYYDLEGGSDDNI